MSDVSDVEAAIVTLVGGITNVGASVQRGWPTEADLLEAQRQSISIVRVHALEGLAADVTRYPRDWLESPTADTTLNVTVKDLTITFDGVAQAGQFVGVATAGNGYAYVVQQTDTPVSIALAFAAAIPNTYAAGPTLVFLADSANPTAGVHLSGPVTAEVGREKQHIIIATWATTPDERDRILKAVISNVAFAYRLPLDDGGVATLVDLQSLGEDDTTAQAGVWRRDLRACYDYPVTYTQIVPPVTVATAVLNGSPLITESGEEIRTEGGEEIITQGKVVVAA